MKENHKGSSGTLVLIMSVIGILVFFIAKFYYRSVNASVDPRVQPARELYKKYNSYTQTKEIPDIIALLDSVEDIYNKYDHYKNSFEIGVLYNNKAAAFLSKIISDSTNTSIEDSLINLAEQYVLYSIEIYENWMAEYNDTSDEEIKAKIEDTFLKDLENYSLKEQQKFLEHRIKEINEANHENERRLSVSYTNLGVIYGRRGEYEKAANCYTEALKYWDRNLTAENNLNALLGKPLRKRTILEKLFPPMKD